MIKTIPPIIDIVIMQPSSFPVSGLSLTQQPGCGPIQKKKR